MVVSQGRKMRRTTGLPEGEEALMELACLLLVLAAEYFDGECEYDETWSHKKAD